MRSNTRWYENGERNSKYFSNLEKRNYAQKHVSKVQITPTELITERKTILQEERKFYETLYTTKNPNVDEACFDEFFKDENVTKLSDCQNQCCEGDQSASECLSSVTCFKSNNTPRTDGLNAEFYKYFWKEVSPCMTESFNSSKKVG